MTAVMIESSAEVTAVRVTADCRCPACDGAMPKGVWGLPVGEVIVCSAECYNQVSFDLPANHAAMFKLALDQLKEELKQHENNQAWHEQLAGDAEMAADEVREKINQLKSGELDPNEVLV